MGHESNDQHVYPYAVIWTALKHIRFSNVIMFQLAVMISFYVCKHDSVTFNKQLFISTPLNYEIVMPSMRFIVGIVIICFVYVVK